MARLQCLQFTRGGELFRGILTDALQEAVAALAGVLRELHQRRVDQGGQSIEYLVLIEKRIRADGLGGLARPAIGEDAQAAKERLFSLAQQGMAPVDGRR